MPQFLSNPSSDGSGTESSSELRPDVAMHRAINKIESSDFYKKADPGKKIAIQKRLFTEYVIPARAVTDSANLSLKDYIRGRITKGKNVLAENTPTVVKAGGAVAHGYTSMAEAAYGFYQKGDEEYNKAKVTAQAKIPYKGPFNLPDTTGVKHGNETLEQVFKNDKNWMESRYRGFTDKYVIAGGGTIAGQGPAFKMAGGIVRGAGLRALFNKGLSAAAGGYMAGATKLAASMLTHASEGYIVAKATHDDPTTSAIGFALLGPIGEAVMGPAEKFVSQVKVAGGDKVLSQLVAHTKKVFEEGGVETTIHPAIIAKVGTPKQKITAATWQMLNELAGGEGWAKATPEAKGAAMRKLAELAPELNDQLAIASPELFQAHVASETNKWRASSPQAHDVLSKMEQISGEPLAKSVTDSVVTKAKMERMVANPQTIIDSVGAAKADSPEFEGPFSKKVDEKLNKLGFGPNRITFEDRGHKLLFYLNVLLGEAKAHGATAAQNKEFNLLHQHLMNRFKDTTFPDLIKMSDGVWAKVEQLDKAGYMKEGQPVRFFRQSEVRPGESPYGHEVWLAREAAAADKIRDMQQTPVTDIGDPSVAPGGKDRRGSSRVNLNDPDSVRELIDMHTIRSNQLSKELSKKGLTSAERSEIEEAIQIENRKKSEQKSHLTEITKEVLEPVKEIKKDRYEEAKALVEKEGRSSTVLIQRNLKVSHAEATDYLERMSKDKHSSTPVQEPQKEAPKTGEKKKLTSFADIGYTKETALLDTKMQQQAARVLGKNVGHSDVTDLSQQIKNRLGPNATDKAAKNLAILLKMRKH